MVQESLLVPRRALISVSDKSGLAEFARRLQQKGIEILSTGGTAKTLRDAGLTIKEVSEHTKFPEIMGGRVKTLHPKIHGGILARRGVDEEVMMENDIQPIDIVIVNLYPFQETVAKTDTTSSEAIEKIDIGGPSMVRSAAKNLKDVAIVVDPSDYPIIAEMVEKGGIDLAIRQKLAVKAFTHTAEYDAAISTYLSNQFQEEKNQFPEKLGLHFSLVEALRYGENPHQKAALYRSNQTVANSLTNTKQHQGKMLSYNNLSDADAALQAVEHFIEEPACVIVKHANPCGIALGENTLEAYDLANRADPTSAFGGIIAFNRGVNKETAQEIISRQFVEVIIAPSYTEDALEVFKAKPNVRILEVSGDGETNTGYQMQTIRGGLLVQEWDRGILAENDLKIVTNREPTHEEVRDMLFAWRVVRMVKSNAIVLCKDGATIGIGAGQTSRVYSSKIAVMKARDENLETVGAALASDAFFPFRDGVDAAAEAGVKSIIQPGGSIRDQEVIDAANEHGIAMIFTGIRHFCH